MRFKILPAIIFFCFALVVAKVFDLALEKGAGKSLVKSDMQASAQGKDKESKKEDDKKSKKKDSHEGDKKEGESAKTEDAENSEKDKKEKDAEGGESAEPGAPEEKGPEQKGAPKSVEITDQAPMEKALLESLSKRRKELDDWANTIAMKESVLNATEKKINSKMDELKKLETQVASLLEQYNKKEDEKNQKLVKIYEGMKPADAAKILDNTEMPILLEIFGSMKEDNSSKIISKMNTNKAKDLTVNLAQQRRLTATPSGAPPAK